MKRQEAYFAGEEAPFSRFALCKGVFNFPGSERSRDIRAIPESTIAPPKIAEVSGFSDKITKAHIMEKGTSLIVAIDAALPDMNLNDKIKMP